MARRQRSSQDDETRLLVSSQRRCCLCYYLQENCAPRKGQIAHLNHDASDSRFDNLVWLCLEHHDDFDSRTSQSKGYTVNELRHYRNRLYHDLGSADASAVGMLEPIDEDAAALMRLHQEVEVQAKAIPRGPKNALALVVPASLNYEELAERHSPEQLEEAFRVGSIFARALDRSLGRSNDQPNRLSDLQEGDH